MKKLKLISAVIILTFTSQTIFACTEFSLTANDKSFIVARTMEFTPNMHAQIVLSPRGRLFTSHAPDGKPAMQWRAKYGYLYFNAFGYHQANDGMNEKGLSFSSLYLDGTKYPVYQPKTAKHNLFYLYLGDWLLGNFKTVAEVKQALKTVHVFVKPVGVPSHKAMIFPLHYLVSDASGHNLVIEFSHGQLKLYDNPTGVLTNEPSFPKQLQHLKQFANLSPYSKHLQGDGMLGLPGDTTPMSRFVKMRVYTHFATPQPNAIRTINLAEHILNNVDIPHGIVREKNYAKTKAAETTQWTVFKDLTHRVLYFKSYENTTLQKIDLNKLDFNQHKPLLSWAVAQQQVVIDVTDKVN